MSSVANGPLGELVRLRGCQIVAYDDFAADLSYFIARAYRDRVSVDVVDIAQGGGPFVTVVATAEYDKLVRLAAWAETARERGVT
jgi:hypothetical protein